MVPHGDDQKMTGTPHGIKVVMWRLTGTLRWSATSARRQSTEKAEAAMAGGWSSAPRAIDGEGGSEEGQNETPRTRRSSW